MTNVKFSSFRPHFLLRGAHRQTLAGMFLPGKRCPERAARHQVALPDGDVIILHDDCPDGWQPNDRAALLVHGMAGCHQSPYMIRVAAKLNANGVRTFRMDLRGCGAGAGLARRPYHAGRSDDLRAAVEHITRMTEASPVALVGFSLGGALTLKLLGEGRHPLPTNIDRAVVVCPPLDLAKCVSRLRRRATRIYERYFVRLLYRQLLTMQPIRPDGTPFPIGSRPASLWEFDHTVTAPLGGFESAADYYERCRPDRFLAGVHIPTLLLAANDDPLVPLSDNAHDAMSGNSNLHPQFAPAGGHLGFIARTGSDPDRRRMDWRIVDWIVNQSAN